MKLFKNLCPHDHRVIERSNAIQLDEMGYPLRLCIVKCSKCGKTDQHWIDVNENALEEIETGKSVLVKWE